MKPSISGHQLLSPVSQRINQLITLNKDQVEQHLRHEGRSRLAVLVRRLPSTDSITLQHAAINDLPIAKNALALAAASSTLNHLERKHYKHACEAADIAIIILGLPLAYPLLDLIQLLETSHLLTANLPLHTTFRFHAPKPQNELQILPNMNLTCSETMHSNLSAIQFAQFFKSDEPLVIRKLAESWPALQKWSNPSFWINQHGHRIVPIERTSKTEPMQESFVTIAEIIHMMNNESKSEMQHCVYMAQHPLLDYIPVLQNDIRHPSYMNVADKVKADLVNVWMGSRGTGTKLHFDSADNFLVQLVGTKSIVLIDPKQSHLLYQTCADDNISPVDIAKPDKRKFPQFAEVRGMTVHLEPGDALYIPSQYWHWVRALSSSISVNFWF